MTQGDRAKQFMPFDAMKGLKEALRDREERHSRVEKRDLSEDTMAEIAEQLVKVEAGATVELLYYHSFHEVTVKGRVSKIDFVYRYLLIGAEKVFFGDIYELTIVD